MDDAKNNVSKEAIKEETKLLEELQAFLDERNIDLRVSQLIMRQDPKSGVIFAEPQQILISKRQEPTPTEGEVVENNG